MAAGKVRRDVESHLRWLEKHVQDVERELDQRIRASPAWREKDDLLRGIPGVGPVLSRTLLAGVPELGTLSNRQAAALWGWRRWPPTAASGVARVASPRAARWSAASCTWRR